MNSYRIVRVEAFPQLDINETISTAKGESLEGFTKPPDTQITKRNIDYHGFELFEFSHEMILKDSGTAFGFFEGEPVRVNFNEYLKNFKFPFYREPEQGFGLIAVQSFVSKDVLRTIKNNSTLKTKVHELTLDLHALKGRVPDFLGAWFRKVSTRVSASALFGADLSHEPIFDRFIDDGATLSSIIIPFKSFTIQINQHAGISSQQRIDDIQYELELVKTLKETLIDPITV